MTPAFLDRLELEYIDGRTWRVTQPFVYRTALVGMFSLGDYILFSVPAGFVTDFASIPRGLWNVLPPTSTCGQASVVHDFLYQTQPCTRAKADAVLNEAMGVLGVSRLTRWLVYAAVRTGGGAIWARHTAELSEG